MFVQNKPPMQTLDQVAAKAEYELIVKTLQRVNFNRKKAAEVLKIDRKTIYNKLKKAQELGFVEPIN